MLFINLAGLRCLVVWENISLNVAVKVGRGVYRSYYKGHKDKIKREGRGGGWRWDWLGWGRGKGENADNCNRITIKIKNKNNKNPIHLILFPQ